MKLLTQLLLKAKYFWHTFRVKDYDNTTVEIPHVNEDGLEQITIVHMPGHMYKTFMNTALTLELDDRWSDEHLDALASYILTYPNDLDEDILRAFLHPEFYEIFDDEEDE